jgi:hypothetical protein
LQRGGHGGLGEKEELTAIVGLYERALVGLGEIKKKKKKRMKKKEGDEADVRGERVFFKIIK